MTIFAAPGKDFVATLEDALAGLAGTLQIGIFLHPGATVVSDYVTTGITENAGGSTSDYDGVLTAPADPSTDGTAYFVQWKNGTEVVRERLVVTGTTPTFIGGTPFDRLKRMTASAEEPTLSDDELNDLLAQSKRPDKNGLPSTDPDWVPTYNLNAAAAEGWLWKAGKAAPNYSFGIDAERSDQSDVFKHCMAMHDQYERGETGSARVSGMIDDLDYLDFGAYGPEEVIP